MRRLIENDILFVFVIVPIMLGSVIVNRSKSMNNFRRVLFVERRVKVSHGVKEVSNGK